MSYSIRWFGSELIDYGFLSPTSNGTRDVKYSGHKLFFILKICIDLCFCLRFCRMSQQTSLCNIFKETSYVASFTILAASS